jgi:cytochrome c biogenesis protein
MDRVDGVLEALWRFLSSMRFAMVLMLALAALGVVGSLVIQAPPATVADPEAYATWLNEVRPKFGGWTGPMDALGLFSVFNSLVFRVLVAALTISLIACSVHRLPGMVRTATKPRVDVGPSFFEHAPQHEAIVVRHTPAETLALVEGVLHARRYRTVTSEDGAIALYADRFRWAPFAGLIGHLSLVVILAGAIIGGTFGYRDAAFTLAEGATLPVASEAGLSLQLLDFTDTYDTRTGQPSDYASQVVVYRDGAEIDRHTIRVNDPLRVGDTTVYQSFFGAAAVMTVADAAGKELVSQGVPLAWRTTADNRPVGSLSIPGTDYVGWVVGTLGAGDTDIAPGQVQVELYDESTGGQVDYAVVDQGSSAEIAGLTVTFERENQFTGLSVARDPGVVLVWIGAAMLFFGFVIRFVMPHKRIWVRIVGRPKGAVVGVASLASKEAALGTEFDGLVSDIRAALAAPAASQH